MIIVTWLLEQCVVVAPVLGVALYLAWPQRRRRPWLKAVTGALVTLFVVNLIGVYPGPARVVSCSFDGGLPVCTERRSGSAETPGPTSRAVSRGGSVGAEVETLPGARGGVSTSAADAVYLEPTASAALSRDQR